MSSGGKGGSANSSLNYYGTLGGALCWGPLDWLNAVILNGNYIFGPATLNLTTDVTDLTGSIADPTLLAAGGYLKLYRGTETQGSDPALAGHPPYKGTALLVAKHIFFGQDSGTAPNLQIIGGRLPRVTTAIVAAVDNVVDDGQVNPIAAWAEVLLDERGAGLDVSQLDAASWLASGHWCAQDQTHRDFSFISPLLTQQSALRDIATQLIDPHGGFCRWTSAGKLACNVYEWGVDPGGLLTVDARHFTRKPRLNLGDWGSVPTELLVNFTDRDYEYQGNTLLVPNSRAAQIRQIDDQQRIDRPHVRRATQAHKHAVEHLRRIGLAPSTGTLYLRQPFVEGLLVGDKIKVDTDPEPGGAGLSQLVRIDKIEQDRSDEAVVSFTTDNLLPAVPYSPVLTAAAPTTPTSPALVNFLAVPLPPRSFGWPLSVAILATRPAASIVGMEVFFGSSHAGAFDDLSQQYCFACRASLQAAIIATDTTINLTELDGLSGSEAGLAADTPGGNTTAAQNNTLLVLLATLDGSGRIALDGNGDPIMEFISIVDRAYISGATFSYTVLRGRLDTIAQAWGAGTVAWIVPRGNLEEWQPDQLATLLGSVAYFRLVSFTQDAEDTTIPVPECSVNMLSATSPMYVRGLQGGNSASVYIYQRAVSAPALPTVNATYTFATGALTAVNNGWSTSIPAGTSPLWLAIAPAFAVGPTDTILPADWATPHILVQNGADGAPGPDGANNATVLIYQRGATAPTLPSAGTVYTFATAVLTGLNNGWSQSIPAVNGQPLWVSAATASNITPTDNIAAAEWAAAVKYVQDGAAGADGSAGLNSASLFIYQRSATAPTLPSAATNYTFATGVLTGLNNGWTQAIPGGADPLYVSNATAISTGATDSIAAAEWSGALIMAQNGAPGATGGANYGTQTGGMSFLSISSTTAYHALTSGLAVTVPSGQRTLAVSLDILNNLAATRLITVRLWRNSYGVVGGPFGYTMAAASEQTPAWTVFDNPGAGTFTYQLQVMQNAAFSDVDVTGSLIVT